MLRYKVVGEYGPVADMSVSLDIDAATPTEALNTFCMLMEADYPSEWERMGRRNVSVVCEIKPTAPPKAVEATQSQWFVRYSGGLGFRVCGDTLFEAVAAAEQHIDKYNLNRNAIIGIEYLAY